MTYRVLAHFIDRENAEMGLWLNPIPEDAIHSIIKRIFHEYKSLKLFNIRMHIIALEMHKLEIISGYIYRKP